MLRTLADTRGSVGSGFCRSEQNPSLDARRTGTLWGAQQGSSVRGNHDSWGGTGVPIMPPVAHGGRCKCPGHVGCVMCPLLGRAGALMGDRDRSRSRGSGRRPVFAHLEHL